MIHTHERFGGNPRHDLHLAARRWAPLARVVIRQFHKAFCLTVHAIFILKYARKMRLIYCEGAKIVLGFSFIKCH